MGERSGGEESPGTMLIIALKRGNVNTSEEKLKEKKMALAPEITLL